MLNPTLCTEAIHSFKHNYGGGVHVYLCFHYPRPKVMSLSREADIMINRKHELMTDH